MKGSRLYIMILGVLLVVIFLFEYYAPKEFVWRPTYDHRDKEPFGSFIFDDIASTSLRDYRVVDRTFYQIFKADSTAAPRAFLLTENNLRFSETDVETLYKMVHLGNRIMICTENFPYELHDTLRFGVDYEWYDEIKESIYNNLERDKIYFGKDTLNFDRIYNVYPQMHHRSIILGAEKSIRDEETDEYIHKYFPLNCDSSEILAWSLKSEEYYKPLVVRTHIGKGEIILVSTPLMFTNYGMLDGDNASYAFRVMSECFGDMPVTRIEAYGNHSEEPETPLRYILSEPPMLWAIYSGMTLLILFMFFTSRRRQRVIPVVTTPPNRTFGFMQLISNLYFQRHDNAEILKMKYMYFCAEVKRLIGVDLQENTAEDADYQRLSDKTGMDAKLIGNLLVNIRVAIYGSNANDLKLKQYIDAMNDILKAI